MFLSDKSVMKHINLDFIGFNNILSSAWLCV